MSDIAGKGWKRPLSMLIAVAMAGPAVAADVLLSAEFTPTSQGFVHTTANLSICADFAMFCNMKGMGSADLPISYRKGTEHSAADPRDQFYVGMPSPVTVQVRNQAGDTHNVVFRITYVTHRTDTLPDGPPNTTPHSRACTQSAARTGVTYASVLWWLRNPASGAPCHSSSHQGSAGDLRSSQVSQFGVLYTLDTPSPWRMKNGRYTGEVMFTVGSGGQIDLGNQVSELNDDTLTLKFQLDVQHPFIVETPPGSELAVLEPQGGWLDWANRSYPPPRLYRDHPLRLWSAGPFKVHTQCEFPDGGHCAIRNPGDGHQVPVEVALSLPSGAQQAGAPALRIALPVDSANALTFDSHLPVLNRPGMLHYQVVQPYVSQMMQRAGARYEGWVRIVFDAQL